MAMRRPMQLLLLGPGSSRVRLWVWTNLFAGSVAPSWWVEGEPNRAYGLGGPLMFRLSSNPLPPVGVCPRHQGISYPLVGRAPHRRLLTTIIPAAVIGS